MGCGMSTEEKEGKARNEEIENQLKRDRMQQRNEIKMLLLGTSNCFANRSPRALYPNMTAQVLVNPESRQS
jgi:hypothetical protein